MSMIPLISLLKNKLFTEFPPILLLNLARFHYDSKNDPTVKLNARYTYPVELDLGRYLSSDKGNLYTLHAVIVHSVGLHDGKYFAFTKSKHIWLKLEDHKVNVVDIKSATEEQYGGEEEHPPFKFTKGKNAIMLLYVRESEKDEIMPNIDTTGKAEHVSPKKEGENDIVTIKVIRDEEQFGRMTMFRVNKCYTFKMFTEGVAEYFGVPSYRLRLHTIWPRNTTTFAEEVGDKDDVTWLLRFDRSPAATGLCAMCPNRSLQSSDGKFRLYDIEDLGKPVDNKKTPKVVKRKK